MTTTIRDVKPTEKGTAVVTLAYTDEDDNTVVPTSLRWQLMRDDGTVINSRTFAAGAYSGTEIVLSGNDLVIFSGADRGERVLSIQGVYNSDAGDDLPLTDELRFFINKLLGQIDS